MVIDFETASGCDLKKCGAFRYSEDPSTEVLCLAYQESDHAPGIWVPGASTLPLMELAEDPRVTFIAHNAQFEKAIWRAIMETQYGFPPIPNERWHDTMAVCAMRVIPLDLDMAIRVLRLPNIKDAEGSAITISLSKPNKRGFYERTTEKLARVYSYCLSDIRGEVGLHNRLGFLPRGERGVWLLDSRINERGVRLDLDFISAAQKVVEGASGPLLGEFAELTGGLKPSQAQKFGQWVKDKGIYMPDTKKETLAAILGSDEDGEEAGVDEWFEGQDLPAEVERALRIRQLIGSASIKKLGRMDQCVCFDGRARGLLQYHGAGPGLWAGRLFQPQNFPRGTIKLGENAPSPEITVAAIMTGDADYVEAVLGPPVECVVSGLRHAIVAERGRVLLAGDLVGIQARTVLALAGQHDKTALMASGADVYLDMAKSIYKRDDLTKKGNPEERQVGKNSVLGLGFQMGARKFRFRYAKEHPIDFAENVAQVYRKEWAPKVPFVWYGLEEAAVTAVWEHAPAEAYGIVYQLEDGWLTARLPSGRKIWYFNPQPIRKPMPWDETIVKPAWTYQARKLGQWKTIDAFGGLLTENVVMGIQRDLMVHAAFNLERNGFPLVLNVHDEWIAEPKKPDADVKAFAQVMTEMPEWAKALQIPVAVEAWEGDRYKK